MSSKIPSKPADAPKSQISSQQEASDPGPVPFINQIMAIDALKHSMKPSSGSKVSFKLPEDQRHTEPSTSNRSPSPYSQLPPPEPYPSQAGTKPLMRRPVTPFLPMPIGSHLRARPPLPRTPSYSPNPKGWSTDMTSDAIGELENKSIQEVLELMEKKYPGVRTIQGVKEHLERLKIQFYS
ncbi:MAG: hypothetical protein Q9217_005558 [Psora testacea]